MLTLVLLYHTTFHKMTPAFLTDAATSDEFYDAFEQYKAKTDTTYLDLDKMELEKVNATDYPDVPFYTAY